MSKETTRFFKQNFSIGGGVMCVVKITGNQCDSLYSSGRTYSGILSAASLVHVDENAVEIAEGVYNKLFNSLKY